MASYGRNFDFRIVPDADDRAARYVLTLGSGTTLAIGAPVKVADGATPNSGYTEALPVDLATGAQAPKHGMCGIMVYETDTIAGLDPVLATYSDFGTAPTGRLVQVVSGLGIKCVFKNTVDTTFLNSRSYTGRTMVAGAGATPTVAVGDYLTPGTGSDAAGYWAETGTAANGWLVVTKVDTARGEVEAMMNF